MDGAAIFDQLPVHATGAHFALKGAMSVGGENGSFVSMAPSGAVKSSKLTSESAPFSFRINSSRRYCKHDRLACHFAVALLVLASQLASRIRTIVGLSADPPPGVHVSYQDSAVEALAGLNHAETVPQQLLSSRS